MVNNVGAETGAHFDSITTNPIADDVPDPLARGPASVSGQVDALKRDGFVMFRNFLPDAQVAIAHADLSRCFAQDIAARKDGALESVHFDGPAGHTVLTEPSHLLIDAYGCSPTLDGLVEKILTDPQTARVIEALVGEDYVFYGYNIRLMTGAYDPAPAHELHRDSPWEFGIGILLTDIEPLENAATAFVPGSHLYPYCPRWNAALDEKIAVMDERFTPFVKLRFFNRLLAKRVYARYTGASGRRGDVYLFTNDIWHGRHPNLHGRKSMVMLVGGCPRHTSLHHKVSLPAKAVLAALPAQVRKHLVERDAQGSPQQPSLLKQMYEDRTKLPLFGLMRLARIERRLFDGLYFVCMHTFLGFRHAEMWWGVTRHKLRALLVGLRNKLLH